MSDHQSLYELLSLSFEDLRAVTLDFSALQTLLLAMVRQLDLLSRAQSLSPGSQQELQPGTELHERTASPPPPTTTDAAGSSQAAQRSLQTPTQTGSEDGVTQLMELEEQVVGVQSEAAAAVDQRCHRVDALEEAVGGTGPTAAGSSAAAPADSPAVGGSADSAVAGSTAGSAAGSAGSDADPDAGSTTAGSGAGADPDAGSTAAGSAGSDAGYTAAGPTAAGSDADSTAAGSTAAGSPGSDAGYTTAGPAGSAAASSATATDSGAGSASAAGSLADGPAGSAAGPPLTTSGPEQYQESVEALRTISELKEKLVQLEVRVSALERGKVDQSQLTHLREDLSNTGSLDSSTHLVHQLNQQTALIDSLLSDRQKLKDLEDMVLELKTRDSEPSSEPASDRGGQELSRQVSSLRRSVQRLETDVKQLEVKQVQSEDKASDQHLQDQLDDLSGLLEEVILNLVPQMSFSLQEREDGSESLTSRRLRTQLKHYSQLQDSESPVVLQQSEDRAGTLQDGQMGQETQNVQLVSDVQKSILQLQADCQNLQETTRNLYEDSRQQQSHIEKLFGTTEQLEAKKADKQMVETEIKADKCVLDSKASRLQLDLVREQLTSMFHELLNRVTDQEQDWSKVMEKLSTEMECKLNRIELDSVKKQLEDRWKTIQQKLQAQEAPEHQDAAGIRKQLVDRFHCLSCDRPIVKYIPGPHLVTLPSSPAFPSHKSMRPLTVYAVEQLRQHYRSDRISELTELGRLVVSRSCGRSHTNTWTNQRRSNLQHLKHHGPLEGEAVIQSEEVDIVGQDGHIYKGRQNVSTSRNTETKLPTISTKDASSKTKDRSRSSPSHKPASSPESHQPASATTNQGSRSASSLSGRDWPVSALGCASQSSSEPVGL